VAKGARSNVARKGRMGPKEDVSRQSKRKGIEKKKTGSRLPVGFRPTSFIKKGSNRKKLAKKFTNSHLVLDAKFQANLGRNDQEKKNKGGGDMSRLSLKKKKREEGARGERIYDST